MSEPDHGSQSTSGDSNVGLFLALYLLLLAFFIVLQSVSQRQAIRADAAMASLNATFRTERVVVRDTAQFSSVTSPPTQIKRVRQEIRVTFEEELPIARFDVLQLGDAMRVSVPAEALFTAGEAKLRLERHTLMERLADALSRQSDGPRLEVEFMVGASGTSAAAFENGALDIRRAGALARDLRARGVPATSIASGIVPGAPGVVRMYFFGRAADALRLSFENDGT